MAKTTGMERRLSWSIWRVARGSVEIVGIDRFASKSQLQNLHGAAAIKNFVREISFYNEPEASEGDSRDDCKHAQDAGTDDRTDDHRADAGFLELERRLVPGYFRSGLNQAEELIGFRLRARTRNDGQQGDRPLCEQRRRISVGRRGIHVVELLQISEAFLGDLRSGEVRNQQIQFAAVLSISCHFGFGAMREPEPVIGGDRKEFI